METAYINAVGFNGEKLKIELSDKLKEEFKLECEEGKFYVVKKEPQYPKTYEECAKVLLDRASVRNDFGYKGNLLVALQKLLVCRDAYWKIAGDWKPDLSNYKVIKYGIVNHEGNMKKCSRGTLNEILLFPTEKMRDIFHDNFKELIEQCKELL